MSRQELKRARWELRELTELTNWENNPRSILNEDYERLKEQITTLGIHNGLLVNQDNIVLGGNIKQIVLYYPSEEYEQVIQMLKIICAKNSYQSHTEAITNLIRQDYENYNTET